MMWDFQSLYTKSKAYVRKGLEHEDPDSPEIPLWCILALELLARAALSKVNPALLADPKDDINGSVCLRFLLVRRRLFRFQQRLYFIDAS